MNRLAAIILLIPISCNQLSKNNQIELWEQEIMETEKNFAQMVQEQGIYRAFTHYAADDAVIMRNNKLYIGKEKIDRMYAGQNSTDLSWVPDFVDVSASGDLAYTYGHYIYTFSDSTGTRENRGVFHTVWKRQDNGEWRFVWD